LAEEITPDEALDESQTTADAAIRDECLVQMREWILNGYSKRTINEMALAMCPWASRRAIRAWHDKVRKSLAITDRTAKKEESVNRGIMRQRLEYLFHTCVCPPKGTSADRRMALECLKMLMQLDGLAKPAPKKVQNNNVILPGASPSIEKVSTEELRRRIEQAGEATTMQDSDDIIDVDLIEDQ
jgi:hypothetical protein